MVDPIVAEVRKNREEWFAEFDYDATKLHEYMEKQRPILEASGYHFETDKEREARTAWKQQREEEENRRTASLQLPIGK